MQQSGRKMDIRKWLAETESPVRFKRPDVEHFLLPKQPDPVPHTRRRQKCSSSDSSLLEELPSQSRPKDISTLEKPRNDVRDAVEVACSVAAHSAFSNSVGSSAARQRYARQPRRKIRPGKYDTQSKKLKEQKQTLHSDRAIGSKKSKQKSKQRSDGKLHNGIGHESLARTNSKDRLTLKPPDKTGLFSNGKSSASVRGRGLPDLVFSEMKFLRNGHDEQDYAAQPSQTKKKRKMDHTRRKEEDVSAYFTSARPALADTHGGAVPSSTHSLLMSSAAVRPSRPERARELGVSDVAVQTNESEGNALYPMTGRGGPSHESSSYFSWSDSVRAPSTAPVQARDRLTVGGRRFDILNREVEEVQHHRHSQAREQMPASVSLFGISSAEKPKVSSIAPKSVGLARSPLSLQRSPSLQQSGLIDRAACHSVERATSSSWKPPHWQTQINAEGTTLPRVGRSDQTAYTNDNAPSAQRRISIDVPNCPLSYQSLQCPTDLDEVLQYYNNSSLAVSQQVSSQDNLDRVCPASGPQSTAQQARRVPPRVTAYAPTARFDVPSVQQFSLPNFSGPNSYVVQEQQLVPSQLDVGKGSDCQDTGITDDADTCESEMLDQGSFEGFSGESSLGEVVEDIDDGLVGVVDQVEQRQEPEHAKLLGRGFWRPHRLY
ncbi:hypothetical protein C7974DRAFT_159766 [Boeremia exigua]|uniref:uncharacterized protein n=1 Tax=Boeremia exigua TaxID=749465 RepID=UPI001E8D6109|nr:uncharacterized protein C7974DRAFT_159766 [Boeremia exigua]KAH6638376.1 hypothetical protein C7974DRAFT_159766 [Boeremia exigua]